MSKLRVVVACVLAILIIIIWSAKLLASASTSSESVWWDDDDVELLAAVIAAEARGEDYLGKLAVGCVIVSRLESGVWGDTLSDVVYYEGQFAEPFWSWQFTEGEAEDADECHQAAVECLEGTDILPSNVLYFRQKKSESFCGAIWYVTIGCHNFYAVEEGVA